MVTDDRDDLDTEICEPLDESSDLVVPPVHGEEPTALRVGIVQSPVLNTFYHEHPVQLTLDTGTTSNMIHASSAKLYGFPITTASQMARQADGVTPMDVIGEVHCSLTRGQLTFQLDALVVRQLDVDILAGNPFMIRKDIGVRLAKRQIEIAGTEIISYSSPSRHTRQPNNGASGKIEAVVNICPTLPPQRKGRLPQDNRNTLEELQNKLDELEAAGVFAKPEQVNVHVEYLNTSFLVKKRNGGSRLVTSFREVPQYSKPQLSLMPNVDNVLHEIGKWKYIVITDLLKSFYQIPLANSSMKYCGIATPFKAFVFTLVLPWACLGPKLALRS
ncbi:hypothetical protein AWC38_SpisGene10379 [Stylophora pistillata]|uniref:Reverse transcriptase domain-containing protein n=1 Tax=Stylophora pistillata TaxID=50429 RepID=A0A2B4S984_STYPI|nr:hypothetical protein AWC38_SpisGene10379 [Stylophora pistillata]